MAFSAPFVRADVPCVMHCWSGSRFLASSQRLAVSPGHEDPMAVVLQGWSPPTLQQLITGADVRECQFQTLDVCLGSSSVSQSGLLGPRPSGEGQNKLSHICGEG